MAAGQITVDLLLKTGTFETDTARAAKSLRKLEAEAAKIGVALGAAVVVAGAALLAFAKNAIDSADALNDVSDATGSSVENLSALQSIAARNGQSFEAVTSVLIKFNKALQDADGKNEVSRALQAIGLDAAQLRREDPAEALRQAAVALSRFADDGDKARLIQILFGKSVKDAGQFLKDLGAEQKLNATLTTQQTEAAEKFNKELFALQANISEVGRRMATDFVIGANEFIAKIRESDNLVLDLHKSLLKLAVEKASFGLFKLKDDNQLDSSSTNDAILARRARDALANRPSVGVVPEKTAAAAKAKRARAERESEEERYLEQLQKQLERTKELTAVETVLADIQNKRIKGITAAGAGQALDFAAQIDAMKAEKEATRASQKAHEDRHEEVKRSIKTAFEETRSIEDANKEYEEQTETLGATRDAYFAIERARISSLIALKESTRAEIAANDPTEALTGALNDQIKALERRQELISQRQTKEGINDAMKKALEEARELREAFSANFEDAFASFLDGSKSAADAFKSFANSVIADLARIQARKIAMAVFGDENGQGGVDWGSVISSVIGAFGGGKATGGPVDSNKAYMVGERGPELFVPGSNGNIVPNDKLRGGKTTINNISVAMPQGANRETGHQFGAAIAQRLATSDRRNN